MTVKNNIETKINKKKNRLCNWVIGNSKSDMLIIGFVLNLEIDLFHDSIVHYFYLRTWNSTHGSASAHGL